MKEEICNDIGCADYNCKRCNTKNMNLDQKIKDILCELIVAIGGIEPYDYDAKSILADKYSTEIKALIEGVVQEKLIERFNEMKRHFKTSIKTAPFIYEALHKPDFATMIWAIEHTLTDIYNEAIDDVINVAKKSLTE